MQALCDSHLCAMEALCDSHPCIMQALCDLLLCAMQALCEKHLCGMQVLYDLHLCAMQAFCDPHVCTMQALCDLFSHLCCMLTAYPPCRAGREGTAGLCLLLPPVYCDVCGVVVWLILTGPCRFVRVLARCIPALSDEFSLRGLDTCRVMRI